MAGGLSDERLVLRPDDVGHRERLLHALTACVGDCFRGAEENGYLVLAGLEAGLDVEGVALETVSRAAHDLAVHAHFGERVAVFEAKDYFPLREEVAVHLELARDHPAGLPHPEVVRLVASPERVFDELRLEKSGVNAAWDGDRA